MRCDYKGYEITVERDEGIDGDKDLISIIIIRDSNHEMVVDDWVETDKKTLTIIDEIKAKIDNKLI